MYFTYICNERTNLLNICFGFLQTNIQTFDIWHANRSCCLINGSNDNSPKDMTCFSIDDFSKSWKFPHPEIVTGLSCEL